MNILKLINDKVRESEDFGFDWPNFQMLIDHAIEECHEISDAANANEPSASIQEEIGDLLHAAISMCIFKDIDVKQTLIKTEKKFANRLKALKDIAAKEGYTTLKGQSVETLLDLWKTAKKESEQVTVSENISIRPLREKDIPIIVDSFAQDNWQKPASIFESYIAEQEAGERLAWVTYYDNQFAGYVTLKWHSNYAFFKEHNIPEIKDLNVLPLMRNKGIGSALLEECEKVAASKALRVGLGVGLYSGYGAAQKLYVERGYIPDQQGITYNDKQIQYGENISLDDNLILWFIKELK